MSAHSSLAPSSAARCMRCTGAVAATPVGINTSSEPAREGTAAHALGEKALQYASGNPVRRAEFWIGEEIYVDYHDDAGKPQVQEFTVDQDMADFIQVYVDQVMREPGELLIEQVLDLSEVYGVPDQKGTADAVVLDHENDRLYVGDLKFGRGVMVFAEGNEQLYSYAAGALVEYDMMGDWKTITVAIHQPRLGHYDEHTLTREELEAFMAKAMYAAKRANEMVGQSAEQIESVKTAGDKQCQWCPIKGSCRTLATHIHEQVYADFTSLNAKCESPREAHELDDELLGRLMKSADLIASTCAAWRAEGLKRVQAGMHVKGWKLVAGRAGRRAFSDEEAAKKIMKGARMKDAEMYKKTLLTAPAAEKVLKKQKPKVWKKLAELITQAAGKPALAEESDPRPALGVATSEQFGDTTTDDLSDLM